VSRTPQEVFQHHAEVLIAGDLEGNATAANSRVEDGIDTFVFRDGEIAVQTVRYTLIT
jgi:hypothetical protein